MSHAAISGKAERCPSCAGEDGTTGFANHAMCRRSEDQLIECTSAPYSHNDELDAFVNYRFENLAVRAALHNSLFRPRPDSCVGRNRRREPRDCVLLQVAVILRQR